MDQRIESDWGIVNSSIYTGRHYIERDITRYRESDFYTFLIRSSLDRRRRQAMAFSPFMPE